MLVLALGVACTVLAALAVSTSMTGMTGMTGMAGMAQVPAVAQLSHAPEVGPPVTSTAMIASAVTAELAPTGLHGSCDSSCVGTLSAVCLGGVASAITFLALLLATRRHTFLGLLRRTTSRVPRGRWPRRTPWATPSLDALCVLRV